MAAPAAHTFSVNAKQQWINVKGPIGDVSVQRVGVGTHRNKLTTVELNSQFDAGVFDVVAVIAQPERFKSLQEIANSCLSKDATWLVSVVLDHSLALDGGQTSQYKHVIRRVLEDNKHKKALSTVIQNTPFKGVALSKILEFNKDSLSSRFEQLAGRVISLVQHSAAEGYAQNCELFKQELLGAVSEVRKLVNFAGCANGFPRRQNGRNVKDIGSFGVRPGLHVDSFNVESTTDEDLVKATVHVHKKGTYTFTLDIGLTSSLVYSEPEYSWVTELLGAFAFNGKYSSKKTEIFVCVKPQNSTSYSVVARIQSRTAVKKSLAGKKTHTHHVSDLKGSTALVHIVNAQATLIETLQETVKTQTEKIAELEPLQKRIAELETNVSLLLNSYDVCKEIESMCAEASQGSSSMIQSSSSVSYFDSQGCAHQSPSGQKKRAGEALKGTPKRRKPLSQNPLSPTRYLRSSPQKLFGISHM